MELKPGIKIHGYTLDGFINSGSTSEVWKVKNEAGQEKALKIFSPSHGVDEATLDLLFHEFRILLSLEHPNILKSEIMGSYNNVPYLIMPYYPGDLASEMSRRTLEKESSLEVKHTYFTETECISLIQQIGNGLAYLHGHGIIHQDVKPENILFQKENDIIHYILSDFGISTKIKENIARMTMPRHQAYTNLTPAYAAPEQFEGRLEFKSDIFSLGVLIFEMCEGRLPFIGPKHTGELIRHGIRPEFKNVSISAFMKQIILQCLINNASDRPSANELLQTINHYIGQSINSDSSSDLRNDSIERNQKNTVKQPVYSPDQTKNSPFIHEDLTSQPAPLSYSNSISLPGYDLSRNKEMPTIVIPIPENKTIINRLEGSDSGNKSGKVIVSKSRHIILISGICILLACILVGYWKYQHDQQEAIAKAAKDAFLEGDISTSNKLWLKMKERSNSFESKDQYRITSQILKNYSVTGPFKNGLAAVQKDSKFGFIDVKGSLVIPIKYEKVMPFQSIVTAACITKDRCDIIDTKGVPYRSDDLKGDPFTFILCEPLDTSSWKVEYLESGHRIKKIINIH